MTPFRSVISSGSVGTGSTGSTGASELSSFANKGSRMEKPSNDKSAIADTANSPWIGCNTSPGPGTSQMIFFEQVYKHFIELRGGRNGAKIGVLHPD
tara:strand:+ start:174 stop:464 length:291 start_codon:yes stop_codon:yes gene_type:complete